MEASTRLYTVEKKASLLHFLKGFFFFFFLNLSNNI